MNRDIMKKDRYTIDAKHTDAKLLEKQQQAIEDALDVLIAESRKDDEDVPWDQALHILDISGK